MYAASADSTIQTQTDAPSPKAKKQAKGKKKVSMTQTATKLIREGKTNAQIYNTLRLTHKLTPNHKWYVQWFRGHVARHDAKKAAADQKH